MNAAYQEEKRRYEDIKKVAGFLLRKATSHFFKGSAQAISNDALQKLQSNTSYCITHLNQL